MTMKKFQASNRDAFTLIELLTVIGVIAVLAALLFPAVGKIKINAAKKRAQTELKSVAVAIDSYKGKLGHYPPDNPVKFGRPTLYYELVGCKVTGNSPMTFTPNDGSPDVTSAMLPGGIVNSSSGSGDDSTVAQSFIKDLKPNQYSLGSVRYLGVAVTGVDMIGDVSPFYYNSSNPTNNPNTYDLWVDVRLGNKTYRINNWSTTPIINP